jgi:hypothetical protein
MRVPLVVEAIGGVQVRGPESTCVRKREYALEPLDFGDGFLYVHTAVPFYVINGQVGEP